MKTKETISREGALGTENEVVKLLCWVQGKKARDTDLHKFSLTKAKTTVDWPHAKSSHSVAQRSSKLGTQNKNQYGTPSLLTLMWCSLVPLRGLMILFHYPNFVTSFVCIRGGNDHNRLNGLFRRCLECFLHHSRTIDRPSSVWEQMKSHEHQYSDFLAS